MRTPQKRYKKRRSGAERNHRVGESRRGGRTQRIRQSGAGFAAGCVAAEHRTVDRSEWLVGQYAGTEGITGIMKYGIHQSNDE